MNEPIVVQLHNDAGEPVGLYLHVGELSEEDVVASIEMAIHEAGLEDDPQDDYWTITGRVTEFQDENRLIVLTAYRAPSKAQPRP